MANNLQSPAAQLPQAVILVGASNTVPSHLIGDLENETATWALLSFVELLYVPGKELEGYMHAEERPHRTLVTYSALAELETRRSELGHTCNFAEY